MKAGYFKAPWGKSIKLLTWLSVCVLLGVAAIVWQTLPPTNPVLRWMASSSMLLLLLGGAMFTIRGYSFRQHDLIVHRLGWVSRVDLRGLVSAEADPEAMSKSIRIAGNGGLFGFSGWFRSCKLGVYRVFGTDPPRAVVLRFKDRTVVITPESPEQFAQTIRQYVGKNQTI